MKKKSGFDRIFFRLRRNELEPENFSFLFFRTFKNFIGSKNVEIGCAKKSEHLIETNVLRLERKKIEKSQTRGFLESKIIFSLNENFAVLQHPKTISE